MDAFLKKSTILFFAGAFAFAGCSAWAKGNTERRKEITPAVSESVKAEGFDIANKDAPPEGVKVRPLLDLELAINEYLVSFEAYREARQSTDLETRAKLPKLLKAYREAYSKAMKMMRDDKLTHPMIPSDPRKLYAAEYKKKNLKDADFKKGEYKAIKAAVKAAVKDGKSPEEIRALIKSMLPQTRSIQAETAGGSSGDPTGTIGSNNNTDRTFDGDKSGGKEGISEGSGKESGDKAGISEGSGKIGGKNLNPPIARQ
ncbi:MAG TPA: hypothetical protein PKM25_12385 [Candidatus Ozemobacteraceae bacterium]|nr:hypothetical protein [Candidatus Ozemobacteraceae bacterium]